MENKNAAKAHCAVTGMDDNIIATKGLCMLVTDEGVGILR